MPFEPFHGVQHGVVFDGGTQDAGAGRVRGAPGPVQALDGKVVRLRAAGGEDDFRRMGAGCGGQRFAGVLHGPPGTAAGSVQRGRVAGPGQFARQGGQGLRGEGGGGGMIKVDGHRRNSTRGRPAGAGAGGGPLLV